MITRELGIFYQAQNDFLDRFADASVLNKPEEDIKNGICTWLSTMAMQIGTDQQKTMMQKCYGIDGECGNGYNKRNCCLMDSFPSFYRSGLYWPNKATVWWNEFSSTFQSLRGRYLWWHQTTSPSSFGVVWTPSMCIDWSFESYIQSDIKAFLVENSDQINSSIKDAIRGFFVVHLLLFLSKPFTILFSKL